LSSFPLVLDVYFMGMGRKFNSEQYTHTVKAR